jgi:hypothetical protein
MSHRFRGVASTVVALTVLLALEAFGMTSGAFGTVAIIAVALIAVAVVLFQADLQWVGIGAACACSFTLTWNGWYVGPVRPGDVLVLLTLLCFVLANPNEAFTSPPWWVKQLALVVLLVAAVQIYFPPDPVYLAHRLVLTAAGQPTVSTKGTLVAANLGVAFKFIVAVAAVPLAFAGAARVDRRAVRWIGIAFATGAALSGTAATIDHLGGNVARFITRIPNVSDRQAGFTTQPNFLAAGLVLAIPFGYWLLASPRRRDRILGAASLPGLLGGVYASGSRGGAVTAVVVLGLCLILFPRTRKLAPSIALGAVFVAGGVAAFVPALGAEILKVTRLGGNPNTTGSDTVRALVGAQGLRDFHHSPIFGIGFQVATEASQVYYQELAAGGLVLLLGMSVYLLSAIYRSMRLISRQDLAAAVCASLIGTLALNIFEADLTDRFYYVPAAILIALMQTEADDVDTEVREVVAP